MSESPPVLTEIFSTGSEKGAFNQISVEKTIVSNLNPDLTFVFNGYVNHYQPFIKGSRGNTGSAVRIGFVFKF